MSLIGNQSIGQLLSRGVVSQQSFAIGEKGTQLIKSALYKSEKSLRYFFSVGFYTK